MSSGVNMLRNSLNISYTTKPELFKLISFKSDQKRWKKYCHADLFKQSFVNFNVLILHKFSKKRFLVIYVTPVFVVYDFRNKLL